MPQGTNGLIVLHQEYKRADATSGGRFATGLKGFHPQNEGVNFRQAYRWGLRGQYLSFVPVRNLASFKEKGNNDISLCTYFVHANARFRLNVGKRS